MYYAWWHSRFICCIIFCVNIARFYLGILDLNNSLWTLLHELVSGCSFSSVKGVLLLCWKWLFLCSFGVYSCSSKEINDWILNESWSSISRHQNPNSLTISSQIQIRWIISSEYSYNRSNSDNLAIALATSFQMGPSKNGDPDYGLINWLLLLSYMSVHSMHG